jgi:sulfur carrier protein ThiS
MTVPDRMTLENLASYLEIPDKPGKVFLVNGSPRDKEYVLQEGDEVKILSFIGGG